MGKRLPLLIKRKINIRDRVKYVNIWKGDVVHVFWRELVRNRCYLGRVEEMIQTKDFRIRSAKVDITQKKKPVIISRLVQKLR